MFIDEQDTILDTCITQVNKHTKIPKFMNLWSLHFTVGKWQEQSKWCVYYVGSWNILLLLIQYMD